MAPFANRTVATLVALALPLVACSRQDPQDSGEEMQAALVAADSENARHAQVCQAAPSLPALFTDVSRYEASIDDELERIDATRVEMGSGMGMGMARCSGPAFDRMSDALIQLQGSLRSYVFAMHELQTLDEARTECAGRTRLMASLIRGMMSDLDAMPCMRR